MTGNKLKIITSSPLITQSLAGELAEQVAKGELPRTILLQGDLGAGKTTFTKGFLKYFGVRPSAASPTFVIMKRYGTKKNKTKVHNVYHIDAYRLKSKEDLALIGFAEAQKDAHGTTLIEWPEKIKGARFVRPLSIRFAYGEEEYERIIKISS